jgi:hypothetical protein
VIGARGIQPQIRPAAVQVRLNPVTTGGRSAGNGVADDETSEGFERFSVSLGGGRSVDVAASGPATGLPLVFHAGTPAGLASYEPLLSAAAAAGLRTTIQSRTRGVESPMPPPMSPESSTTWVRTSS